ncbi:MAG: restriction endonuclease subunit S [Candidatus Thermoplasmatota archaeon]|nr:restriction endonuclease subunit S [Candidatus Thermoplasmatota archaeon]MCL5955435.1 restriction endonuclease subunit S [Candidatus Thermoplasmatota archaeon]
MDSEDNGVPSQKELLGKRLWAQAKLKDICERIFSGGTPFTRNPEYWNGHLLWLSSGETSNRLIRDTKQKITTKGANNSSTRLAAKDSTVIASAGQGHTRGQASLLMVDVYINQSVVAIKGKESVVDPYFLFYSLVSRYERFRQISDAHSIRGSLTTKVLSEETILLPPLNIQKTIGQILLSLDLKIELNQQMNKTLESIAQTLFKHWFIDFEFPDENGQPYKSSGGEMVDSELGEIPNEWKIGKIKDLATVTSGKRPGKKSDVRTEEFNVELIGASSVMGFVKDSLYTGKIILTGRVGTHGILQRVNKQSWPSDNTLVLKPIRYEYIFQCLKLVDFGSLNIGSTQPLITQTQIKEWDIVIPPNEILGTFELFASSLYSKVDSNKDESRILSSLRDLLLPQLISGKIRVPLEDTNV